MNQRDEGTIRAVMDRIRSLQGYGAELQQEVDRISRRLESAQDYYATMLAQIADMLDRQDTKSDGSALERPKADP